MTQTTLKPITAEIMASLGILTMLGFYSFPGEFTGASLGVDVLFVASGFLCSSTILKQLEAGHFLLLRFYQNSAMAILPTLVLVLCSCLLAGVFTLWPKEYALLGDHTLATAAFIQNYVFAAEFGIGVQGSVTSPLSHLWPLAVVAQFYLVWPFVLSKMANLRRWVPVIIGVLMLASFLANTHLVHQNFPDVFYLTHTRAWQMLLGTAAAWLMHTREIDDSARSIIPALAGILALVFAIANFDGSYSQQLFYSLLVSAATAAIIIYGPVNYFDVLLGRHSWIKLFLSGCVSIYMWYWSLLWFAKRLVPDELPVIMASAALLGAFAFTLTGYQIIVKPLKHYRTAFAAIFLATILLAVAANSYLVSSNNGLPDRFPGLIQALEERQRVLESKSCKHELQFLGSCLTNKKPLKIAIIGDNLARSTFSALEYHHRDNNQGLIAFARNDCPALLNLVIKVNERSGNCDEAANSYLHWILSKPEIKTVYISHHLSKYIHAKKHGYSLRYVSDSNVKRNRAAFKLALAETLGLLLESGKEVIFVVEWPTLPFSLLKCADALQPNAVQTASCSLTLSDFAKESRISRNVARSVLRNFPEVLIWDTPLTYCNKREENCRWIWKGRSLYDDPSNLSIFGAQFLGKRLKIKEQPLAQYSSDH